MYRNVGFVLALAFGGLIVPAQAFAQLTPPAGSAGAGNAAINGIPFGPANPRILVDPSGVGNASSIPPLRANPPTPSTSYGSVYSSPPPPRVVTPPYASRQTINAHSLERRRHEPRHRRGRSQVSTFTGICRGC